jgi:hypothetical protein
MRKRGIVGVVGAVAVATTGIAWYVVSSPGGLEARADDRALSACLADAGLDLDGAGDWSGAQERAFLAQPGALDCVLTTTEDEDLPDTLGRAFPEIDDSRGFDSAREQRVERTEVLVDWVEQQPSEVSRDVVVDDLARVLGAFDEIDDDLYESDSDALDNAVANEAMHLPLAFAVHLQQGGSAPGYADWLERTDQPDGHDSRIRFVQEQQTEGTRFGDAIREIRSEIDDAREDA